MPRTWLRGRSMAGTSNSSVDQRGLTGTRKDRSAESMTFAGHQARSTTAATSAGIPV
ncbi:hypothetical protein AB0D14_08990 [Streptomyces sp. NPDC048484]|uniref:hypothetical protein n=1 Tax=Streptomyces sp. NPDC048484 TaxID=3155146 RepID=UPI00341BFF65